MAGKRFGGRPGRPPGSPNKLGRDLREMTLQALAEEGGVDYLRRQARRSPKAFLALLARILPLQAQIAVATVNRPATLEEVIAATISRPPPTALSLSNPEVSREPPPEPATEERRRSSTWLHPDARPGQ